MKMSYEVTVRCLNSKGQICRDDVFTVPSAKELKELVLTFCALHWEVVLIKEVAK